MTREQRRAQLVYERLKPYKNRDQSYRDNYGSMALRFPALVRSAGLVQALAFVDSRGKDEHRDFVHDLAAVLAELNQQTTEDREQAFNWLFEQARKADLPHYLHLTRETLAVADWFKRFAQSILKAKGVD